MNNANVKVFATFKNGVSIRYVISIISREVTPNLLYLPSRRLCTRSCSMLSMKDKDRLICHES